MKLYKVHHTSVLTLEVSVSKLRILKIIQGLSHFSVLNGDKHHYLWNASIIQMVTGFPSGISCNYVSLFCRKRYCPWWPDQTTYRLCKPVSLNVKQTFLFLNKLYKDEQYYLCLGLARSTCLCFITAINLISCLRYGTYTKELLCLRRKFSLKLPVGWGRIFKWCGGFRC